MANQNPTGKATGLLTDGTQDSAYTLDESTLLQGFVDPDNDTLSVSGLLANNGELADLGNGQWRFTPDSGFSGTVAFNYFVVDGKGGDTTGSLSLNIVSAPASANHNPTGKATSLLTDGKQDTAYTLDVATLLQGFVDSDNDTLSVSGLLANSGELADLGKGQWRFTPDTGFSGTVVFDYFVVDGKGGDTTGSLSLTLLSTTPTQTPPTGKVTMAGSARQNQTLTAHPTLADANGLGTFDYQWLRDGAAITGATSAKYTLTQAEVGKTISVKASYTDGLGQFESVTSNRLTVSNVNDRPIGQVTVNNTSPQVGQILTAAHTLADVDGLGTVNYVWQAGKSVLGTDESYAVTANDLGKTITVTASYTDGFGTKESVSSMATAAVIAAPAVVTSGFIITKDDVFTSEDGDTAIIYVALATLPSHDVSVTLTSSDKTEGKISNATLTFTKGNGTTAQAVTVKGQNDYLDDGNQPYILSATIRSNAVEYRQLKITPIVLENREDVTIKASPVEYPRIPMGTPRDMPIKLYGDIQVDTSLLENGLFKQISSLNANDKLEGLDGNDTLYGGNLQDDLSGGIGNDELYGGYDEDFLYGQLGGDTLYGGYGNDSLYGDDEKNSHGNTDGNDVLYGEEGNDYLSGGGGNDTLDGGLGLDTLTGGAGNDTYYLSYDKPLDVITDNGLKADIDTVIMPYQLNEYTLPQGIENGTIDKGTAASNLTGNDGDNTLTGNDGSNTLNGESGNDTLYGGAGNDSVNGGTGNDMLIAGNGLGDDAYVGGTGIDTVKYLSTTKGITVDLALGTASGAEIGTDLLYSIENVVGGVGGDSLSGAADNNLLDGYSGNDTLIGGMGNDTLQGGLGADRFTFNAEAETGITSATQDTIADFKSAQGDKLDVSAIDANTALAGNNAFSALTTGGTFNGVFANPGDLYFDKTAHVLYGNNDADSAADFSILLVGVGSLAAGNLLL